MSRNELREIPEDVGSLRVLRVLSIRHNKLKTLPLCLGAISAIRMLKLEGNPWNHEMAGIIDHATSTYGPSNPARSDDSERDRYITSFVVENLRRKQNELSYVAYHF